jgi:hypothetical protein
LLNQALVEVDMPARRDDATPLAARAGTIIPAPPAPPRDPTDPVVIVDQQLQEDALGLWAWQTGAQDAITGKPGRLSRRWWYASGGLVASAVTVALLVASGGSRRPEPAPVAAAPPTAFVEVTHPIAASEPPMKPATVELGPPVVANAPAAIVKPGPAAVEPAKPARASVDVDATYRSSLQRFTRGDTAGAVSSLRTLLANSPAHSPSWRTLGIIYEKLGETARARDAYRRYLQLAPPPTSGSRSSPSPARRHDRSRGVLHEENMKML